MQAWSIAFIILCLIYGPIYVIGAIVGIAAVFAPGTASPGWAVTLAVVIFGLPFIGVGYMALR